MGYLGYDPDGLLRLRAYLDAVAEERARTRFDDPLGVEAGREYQRAADSLLATRHRIDTILGCGLGREFRPVRLDVELAVVDVLRLADPAWTIVTDPGIAVTDPVLAAVHLAEYLAARGVSDAFEPATAAELLARLGAVAADPRAAAAFVAELGSHVLALLFDDLWAAIAGSGDEARGRAEAALDALAPVLASAEQARPGTWTAFLDTTLAAGHPVTVLALVTLAAGLPAALLRTTFVRLADASMARDEPEPVLYGPDGSVRWSTPQALAEAVTAQPAVANDVVRSLDAGTFAWLLSGTAGASTGRLLVAATSPALHASADAEAAAGNVLRLLAGRHRFVAPDLRAWLGAMVAPWSAALVSLPRPAYTDAWAIASDPAAVAEIRWILRAREAADVVTWWLLTATPDEVSGVLAAGPPTTERLYDWAEQVGVAAGRLSGERLAEARRRLDRWRRGWKIPLSAANSLAVHAADLDLVTGFVTAQFLGAFEDHALDEAVEAGRLGAPPPIEAVTVDEVSRVELIEATAVAAARRAMFERLVAAGDVGAGAEPPPGVHVTGANPMEADTEAMRAWLVRARPVIGATAVDLVSGAGNAVESGFGRGHQQAAHDAGTRSS